MVPRKPHKLETASSILVTATNTHTAKKKHNYMIRVKQMCIDITKRVRYGVEKFSHMTYLHGESKVVTVKDFIYTTVTEKHGLLLVPYIKFLHGKQVQETKEQGKVQYKPYGISEVKNYKLYYVVDKLTGYVMGVVTLQEVKEFKRPWLIFSILEMVCIEMVRLSFNHTLRWKTIRIMAGW